MQLNGPVARAIAESQADDRRAYEGLGPAWRLAADRVGDTLFNGRRFAVRASKLVLRGSEQALGVILEWLLWLGDKILFGPYRSAVRAIVAFGRAVTGALKWLAGSLIGSIGLVLAVLDALLGITDRLLTRGPGSSRLHEAIVSWRRRLRFERRRLRVLKRAVRRAIERGWQHLGDLARRGLIALGQGIDWFARNVMFRPLVWLFNPRLPNGNPLLLHEGMNRTAGFLLAAAALYLGVLVLAYVKAMALLLHGTINVTLWKVDAPLLLNLVTIGLAHAAISLGVAASKFVLLPVLAAARRGIKNNAFTQAIAHCYVRRKHADERRDEKTGADVQASPRPRASLAFVERLVQHIVTGTVPETYEVKLRQQSGQMPIAAG